MSKVPQKAFLLFTSLTISLLLSEGAARVLLNPADYLTVSLVRDDILGIRVAQGTTGFDRWGFRNRSVPRNVDIVAIGDSHTYGNNARMSDSWPYVVARLTGRSVYNLALGGYGPNQYYHLLQTYALNLNPRWVICGLYMGDDFENAYLMTYGKDHWSFLRKGRSAEVDADIWEQADGGVAFQRLRQWLSRNSVIYQLAFHGPLFGELKGVFQIRQAAHGQDTTSLIVTDAGIQEAFRPKWIRDRLNQRSAAVREGMRITFELLAMMDGMCHKHGCQFVVALIPTKEMVFREYLLRDAQLPLRDVIAEAILNEEEARKHLFDFLKLRNIPSVDVLPYLRRNLREHLYTRSDRDMHPNRDGYKAIGAAVAEFFK